MAKKTAKKAKLQKVKAAKPAPKKKLAKPAAKAPVKKVAKAAVPKAPAKKPKAPDKKLAKKPLKQVAKAVPAKPPVKAPIAKEPKKEKLKAKAAPEPQEATPKREKAKSLVQEEVLDASEMTDAEVEASESEEVVLTDAEGRRYCRVRDCDQLASVDTYCRYHYLLYWKKIQIRKKILTEGKLERYIEELTARYPDKFLEMLKKDLRTEKEFLAAIQELEIDESAGENEFEDDAQTYIDEVRGMGETPGRETEEDY
ncbi:MAG: hypothetical protein AB7F86_00095 [Bdellovibrionales bacterium]